MSDLVGNPEDRFSRVAAHVINMWHPIRYVQNNKYMIMNEATGITMVF